MRLNFRDLIKDAIDKKERESIYEFLNCFDEESGENLGSWRLTLSPIKSDPKIKNLDDYMGVDNIEPDS